MPLRRKKQTKRPRKKKGIPFKFLIIGFTIAVIVAPFAYVFFVYHQLPNIPDFNEYAENCPKTSRVYAKDGRVAGEFFIERRTLLSLAEIPENFKRAAVASEDADFYTHGGLSPVAIVRALLKNMLAGEIIQGGSTITQQLAKNFFLSAEKTVRRKFYEALFAWKLERKLSKEEILAMYLNQIYFGHGRYGIEEASLFYFGRVAKELKLNEVALIIGLIPAPEIYSPFRNIKLAKERQKYVLSRMTECGMIKKDEALRLAAVPLKFAAPKEEEIFPIGEYYLDEIRRQVIRQLGWTQLYHGGLKIFSPMDIEIQKAADSAIFLGLHMVDKKAGVYSGEAKERSLTPEMINSIFREGLNGFTRISGLIFTGRVTEIDTEKSRISVNMGGGIEGVVPFASFSRLFVSGKNPADALKIGQTVRLSFSGNFLKHENSLPLLNLETGPQGAIVVIENKTRKCLALSGGDDFEFRKFNRATMARREVGSVIKPFIYAAGIAKGMIDPGESFENSPLFLKGRNGIWIPSNYEGFFDYRAYGLREALAKSINVIAVKVLMKIGLKTATDFLVKLGVERESIPKNLSLALGNLALTPMHLTNMFATFGSDGKYDDPILIERILSYKGELLFSRSLRERQVLGKAVLTAMKGMLSEVMKTGTAKEAASLSGFLIGKTGTSDSSRDLWFVGSDEKITAGVFIGYDDRLELKGGSGAKTALPVWIMLMKMIAGSGRT